MRILQVTDTFAPALGGLERHVATLSSRLAQEGDEVAVATLSYPEAPEREEVDGYTVHRLEGLTRHLRQFARHPGHYFHPTVPDPSLVVRLQRIVDSFRPDIVHAHGWILSSCVALRLPPTTALVATLHEYGLVCAKKTYTRTSTGCPTGPQLLRCIACAAGTYGPAKSVALTIGLRAVRPLYRRVDRWIAISTAVAKASRPGLGAGAERLDIIPTFVPDDLALIARTPLTLKVPDEPFLLFVGAMGPHKGLDILLAARRRMSHPVPLVVLGTPRDDAPDLDQPGVTVHLNVPHPQVMAAWAAATVGVVPSVWPEPLGQVAIECLAAGTPAVVSDTGGLGDVVRNEVDGLLVPPGDPEALALALNRMLNEPGLRPRLAASAPDRAREFEIGAVMPALRISFRQALAGLR